MAVTSYTNWYGTQPEAYRYAPNSFRILLCTEAYSKEKMIYVERKIVVWNGVSALVNEYEHVLAVYQNTVLKSTMRENYKSFFHFCRSKLYGQG